jgi:zinc D-Ala-D-Ala carboxypeptidase
MTQLSKNFTLEELTVTNTGLPNVPNDEEIKQLTLLATTVLQPIRDVLGPVIINSGFRGEAVNAAVGGVLTSQHRLGQAADTEYQNYSLEDAFEWIRHHITFGQLIIEEKHRPDGSVARWIHVSLPRHDKPNMMCLKYEDGVYLPA